jgi:hypothetical protein
MVINYTIRRMRMSTPSEVKLLAAIKSDCWNDNFFAICTAYGLLGLRYGFKSPIDE